MNQRPPLWRMKRHQINVSIEDCDVFIAELQQHINTFPVLGILYENILKFSKVEKMIYTALLNPTTKREIYPRLLAKYDELLEDELDFNNDQVAECVIPEGQYLRNCEHGLKHRNILKAVCDAGVEGVEIV